MMISDLFLRRSLALLPVDSRAVVARYKWESDPFEAAKAIGALCSYYDSALATLRAAAGPAEDDDDEGDDSTPLDEPESAERELVAKGHVS